ncbi:hypothetical protein L7F22_056503 [Adiantum nelumboides]|nr:hypothetical protein [Adiantum nelumboides]
MTISTDDNTWSSQSVAICVLAVSTRHSLQAPFLLSSACVGASDTCLPLAITAPVVLFAKEALVVQHQATGELFACKSISKRKLAHKEDIEDVRREVQIMHHLTDHPNIVELKGSYEDKNAVHLVMELCAGGELFDRIIAKGKYTEREAAAVCRTIVQIIQTCHSLGVMHRDLKPENFIILNKSEDSPLKTIDFGLSVFFKPGDVFKDVVGSAYYVAPKVLRRHYGPEVDVWSIGVILYILLSGILPFWVEKEQGIFDAIMKGHVDFTSDPWLLISSRAKDLIRKMLNQNVKERIGMQATLNHPWIRVDGEAPDRPLDNIVLSRMKQFRAMNKLEKHALKVIAENLSEEEILGLKEMFRSLDVDNSGTLTKRPFEGSREQMLQHGEDCLQASSP